MKDFLKEITEKDICEAFQCFEIIGNTNSTNDKKKILEEYKDNKAVRQLLLATYDPFVQYYVKKLPNSVFTHNNSWKDTSKTTYENFTYLLFKLRTRRATGNLALEHISAFLSECNEEEQYWYSRVLTRDLRIGINVKTINSVIKNLIPVYTTMLANKVNPADLEIRDNKALKKLPNEYCVQPKLDGVRLNIHVTEDEIVFRTRNGKIVTGYNDLETDALNLPKGYVYDGEIISKEFFDFVAENMESDDKVVDRSHFQDTMKQVFAKTDNKQGVFVVFDMVSYYDWCSERSTKTYKERLEDIEMKLPKNLENIKVVPMPQNVGDYTFHKDCSDDIDTTLELFSKYLNLGYEGLMIKDLNAVYEFKRTNALIKLKEMDTLDLSVVSVFEGTGKYKDKLGYITVEYKGSLTGVGSGFTDAEREYYWNNPQEIIGKTIEVSYQAETQNKDGAYSLSFPIYKGIRYDK